MASLGLRASHIVGGEMSYDYIGSDNYKITLKIYRNCNVESPFDGTGGLGVGPAYLTVYDAGNNLIGRYDIGSPSVTRVPPAFSNPCIQVPTGTCIEEGVYTYVLNLPPISGGYTVIYQRCCRNAGVANLVNSDLDGSTYYTTIPGPEEAANNSSPRFTKFPPIYICNNVPFQFDHSATDPDGDQLVYSLCAPYNGLDGCCASIGAFAPAPTNSSCPSPPASCPTEAPPPPYANVIFSSPYSGSYPIASNPAFAIDPITGQLSGTPTLVAQYVVGVCIQEYRNNQLIGTHFRDFQFTVIGCTVSVLSAVADQKQKCEGQNIAFTNQSINNSATPVYHWDFGVTGLSNDTSNLLNPTYQYPDTGIYTITLITNPGKPCTDTLKKPVYVYPPLKIKYDAPGRQCFVNNSFNFAASGDYVPQATFNWDFTALATPSTSTLKNPSGIQFLQSGLYLVTLKAQQFACRDSFTDSVIVIGRPKAMINNLQNGLCAPARINFGNGSSSELPLSYNWTFSNGHTSHDFAPTEVFSPAGVYGATLVVQTTQLCNDSSMAYISNITVSPKPQAAFTFSPHETSIFEPYVEIDNASPNNDITVIFDFGDGDGSIATQNLHGYQAYGNYTIKQTVVNVFGCSDTVSDVVKILPEFRCWMPNCFTPDNSQLNDFFMPVTFGVVDYELEIFDRWGRSIYKTNNSSDGWNGNYKGQPCQQGIYAWRLTFKNVVSDKKETRMGHVTLLRNE